MKTNTNTSSFLLVEGNDDRDVFSELRDQSDISRDWFQIKVAGSKSELDQQFVEQLLANDRQIIGIVRDADENINTSWQSVKNLIKRAGLGYVVPTTLNSTGIIIEPPNAYLPRLGVWLMPDNQSEGELEDFVRECIVMDDALIPHADDALDRIEETGIHRYKGKRSKAFIYTWLAWQEEPGIDMRKNFKQGVLSANSPIAQTFVDWLNRLFNA